MPCIPDPLCRDLRTFKRDHKNLFDIPELELPCATPYPQTPDNNLTSNICLLHSSEHAFPYTFANTPSQNKYLENIASKVIETADLTITSCMSEKIDLPLSKKAYFYVIRETLYLLAHYNQL
jgi:hypothetical protein